ncbi:MAG: riboflavin synthase [Steroidobacteraceae bacterium]
MFTGIVRAIGRVEDVIEAGGDRRISVSAPGLEASSLALGESIAVSGVCLTVTEATSVGFMADVSRETLERTTLGRLQAGSPVNLEPALRVGDPLGGHYVTGHVDAVGQVVALSRDARSWRVRVAHPESLARFIASKGSVAVEGVSLTVNEVDAGEFGVNLIPHTWEVTTLGTLAVGTSVNLEVDLVARYLERMWQAGGTR